MNSPQRTACLAKGGKNMLMIRGHFLCTDSLAMLHVRQVEHRQTDRQYVIPSLVGSENLCQTMNGSVETACVTKR